MKYLLLALIPLITLANEKGKAIYTAKCISCHNANPAKKGSVGPDIADANLSLLILKTQHRKYPAGYKPKRKTNMMPKIPLKEKQLMDLYEYISSFK